MGKGLALLPLLPLLFGVTQGWHLMLKVPQGADLGGAHSVYDLWTSNETLNEDEDNSMHIQPGIPFKSADVLKWDNKSINLVKVSLYTGGTEQAYVVFGAGGPTYNHSDWPVFDTRANRTNWFDCSRIVQSSWGDLLADIPPEFCNIHSEGLSTLAHSFSLLNHGIESQSDCQNLTGWLTVMEPASDNSVIQCPWKPSSISPPQFLFSSGNSSLKLSDPKFQSADVLAIYVDDCINEALCHHGNCWQDPLGECFCNGYKCNEVCSHLPCTDGLVCLTDKNNESAYSCISPPTVGGSDQFGVGPIVGLVLGVIALVALVAVGICCFIRYRNREDELKTDVTHRAVLARDFVRRSVHRLSGREHNFPRRHLKEEKPSPPVKGKSEQTVVSPDSSVVFGETNPAFMCEDDPPTPQPTPPPDRRYTEFPTRSVAPTVSATEIQLHEKNQKVSMTTNPLPASHPQRRYENAPFSRPDSVTPHPVSDFDRASTIGSFEKASTMSEISDATSTSGYSDYTGDTPANLPPSEMISKDVLRQRHYRHKARSRPRSRTSTVDPPKTLAPQTVESQISYAMEHSRRSISSLSSLSSDATHRSDGTVRSGELTKSEVLKARYENFTHGDRLPRFPKSGNNEGPSYEEIKKQLDEDMSRREARERKVELEMEREAQYQAQRALKHRMRQVESLDSGIDAEHAGGDRSSDGRIEIVRARSADQLDSNCSVTFMSKEATV